MDLSTLAAKQKRVRDWSEFLFTDGLDESLRLELGTTLELYKKVLVSCWERQTISADDQRLMASYERQLEELNDRVRLSAPVTMSRDFSK